MDAYLLVKTLHVLSATVLLGTGAGIAFFMWRALRSRDPRAVAVIAREVVLADWLFTAPSVVFQLGSGLWLAWRAGWLTQGWVLWSLVLFFFTGACWLPVVWLQLRLRDLAAAAIRGGTALDARFWRLARIWLVLGYPAFAAVLAILYLMVAKPH